MSWILDTPEVGTISVPTSQNLTEVRVTGIEIDAPVGAAVRIVLRYAVGYIEQSRFIPVRSGASYLTEAQSAQFLNLPITGSNFRSALEAATFLALTTLDEIGDGTRT